MKVIQMFNSISGMNFGAHRWQEMETKRDAISPGFNFLWWATCLTLYFRPLHFDAKVWRRMPKKLRTMTHYERYRYELAKKRKSHIRRFLSLLTDI